MKRYGWVGLSILFFLAPAFSHSSTLGDMRITLLEGDVQVRGEEATDWLPVAINTPLMGGDTLWIPERGRLEFQLREGTYVRVNEKSSLQILTADKDAYQFYLTTGNAHVNFTGRRGASVQLDTPAASLRAFEPSLFSVDVDDDGLHRVSVFKGTVDAETPRGKTSVRSGNLLSFRGDYDMEVSALAPPDAWARWNMARDHRLSGPGGSARYLPEELQPYRSDFDEHGRWVYASGYGYVWRPTLGVSIGWAPYRAGRWVWMRGDYVWISHEPWGWCPYHYGRWAFVVSLGWFWVPPVRGAVYWGPGFVGWIHAPTYVSWVPLAPGEIYYGYGTYGPHSVNITNVNINQIRVTRGGYRNIHVHNGVTVVHRETFITGRHTDVPEKGNPFLREKISVGRPNIRPEKATLMPAIKEVSPENRPPQPMREVHVKEIREKRPMVRDRETPVLSPRAPTRERGTEAAEKARNRPGEWKAPQPEIHRPQEHQPFEKGRDRSTPPPAGPQRSSNLTASERAPQPPRVMTPPEKIVGRPMERGKERPGEYRPSARDLENPRGDRLREKESEKAAPALRTLQRGRESHEIDKGLEQPRQARLMEQRAEKNRVLRPNRKGNEKTPL